MAADDGAERGQGSKPCIVSLPSLSRGVPSLSRPLPSPSNPCCLLHIYIHLSTQCVAMARRARGCTERMMGWLPCSLRRCSSRIHSKSHICRHLILGSGTGAQYILASAWNVTVFYVRTDLCERLHARVRMCACVCVCVCRTRHGLPSPPHLTPVLGLPSSPLVPPPIPTTLYTHLPHFACVILASWPCWLIPLHWSAGPRIQYGTGQGQGQIGAGCSVCVCVCL